MRYHTLHVLVIEKDDLSVVEVYRCADCGDLYERRNGTLISVAEVAGTSRDGRASQLSCSASDKHVATRPGRWEQ